MYIASAMDGYSTNVSPAHRGDMVQLLPRPPAQTFACSDNLSVKPLPRTPANLKTYVYYTLSNTERTCLSRVGLGLFLSSRVPGFFFGFRLSIETKKKFLLVGSGLGLKIFAHVCLLCSSKSSLPRVESLKNYFSIPNSNPKATPKAGS